MSRPIVAFCALVALAACESSAPEAPAVCRDIPVDVALPQPASSGALALVSVDDATHIAVASGDWSDACIWRDGALPGAGARVLIPANIEVRVDGVVDANISTIGVYGELSFDPAQDTELRVNTLVSAQTGNLEVGSEAAPISDAVTARILFTADTVFDESEDPLQLARGAILMGQTTMHGAAKTHRSVLATHPRAGDAQIELAEAPSRWTVGDAIVIAGTQANDPQSDERRIIAAISGTTVTLDAALIRDHVAPDPDLEVHVANLTRNIQIASESSQVEQRGHVMFMHTLMVDVRHARFEGVGRTNKRVQVDDWYFPDLTAESATPGPRTNIRGRYAVHFHRGGVDPNSTPAHVEGCVVEDNPGWGYVNHSSHVDFVNNVAYDVVGGAFQTEAGDEQGSFVGNIALRTVNPDYPIEDPATAPVDIREDSQDFAFQGDGFWIHGGGVRLEDNVASGSSGHGFIFWTEGLREEGTAFDEMNRFEAANVPNGALLEVETINAWWVSIAGFTGNRTYASNRGLAIYYVHTTLFEDIHDLTPAYLDTLHSTFEDLDIWNVGQMGIHVENSTRFTVRDLRIINSGGDPQTIGIHTRSTVGDRTIWDNVTVKGFGTGMVVPTQGDITIRGGTWSNFTDFFIVPPQFEPGRPGDNRDLLIEDVTFERAPSAPADALNVELAGAAALNGQLAEHNEEDAHRLLFVPDRIVLSSNLHARQQLYFAEQAADTVPINPSLILDEAYGGYLDDVVGQSNAAMSDALGLSFAGRRLPDDAVPVSGVGGGLGAPPHAEALAIPACLFIDEPPPPANIFDDFDFYACWDDMGGSVRQVEPFEHGE